MKRFFLLPLSVSLLGGCVGYEKSGNPLRPSVAGPIPGVSIAAPIPILPPQGSKLAVDEQPITLMVENASTSGVRPLNYVFEVAIDLEFTNKIFVREGVEPGGNGQTTLPLPDLLAPERSYYWRAKAQDGANTGPYSHSVVFNVFTPIVIGKPVPISPTGSANDVQPRFVIGNAQRSGPVGPMVYWIEVSDNDAFTNMLASWAVPEQPTQTTRDSPIPFPSGRLLFWRTRASEPTTTGPWSDIQVFQVLVSSGPSGECASVSQRTPLASLQAIRPCYPTPMSHAQKGDMLNRVAWEHRAAGYGLHFKGGGNLCPQPGGTTISCDIIVHGPTQAVYDVLLNEDAEATPTWGFVGKINTMANFVDPVQP